MTDKKEEDECKFRLVYERHHHHDRPAYVLEIDDDIFIPIDPEDLDKVFHEISKELDHTNISKNVNLDITDNKDVNIPLTDIND